MQRSLALSPVESEAGPGAYALAEFTQLLCAFARPRCHNFWVEGNELDAVDNTPSQRLSRLLKHLRCAPRAILIGEAPGYQGAKFSGLAFTSEALLLDGVIPRIEATPRLSGTKTPFREPSATIVWKTLYEAGLAEETILWNAFPVHPFREGQPLSNRTPGRWERDSALTVLQGFLLLYRPFQATIYAVGRQAQITLAKLDVAHVALRHPAHGGARQFRQQLLETVVGRGDDLGANQ